MDGRGMQLILEALGSHNWGMPEGIFFFLDTLKIKLPLAGSSKLAPFTF